MRPYVFASFHQPCEGLKYQTGNHTLHDTEGPAKAPDTRLAASGLAKYNRAECLRAMPSDTHQPHWSLPYYVNVTQPYATALLRDLQLHGPSGACRCTQPPKNNTVRAAGIVFPALPHRDWTGMRLPLQLTPDQLSGTALHPRHQAPPPEAPSPTH